MRVVMSLTTNPSDPRLNRDRDDSKPGPQNQVYLVLSEEERAKGFVRPVRHIYRHVGDRSHDGEKDRCQAPGRSNDRSGRNDHRDPWILRAGWKTIMTTPIRHTPCGKIVAWYVGDPSNPHADSASVLYLDGSRPLAYSMIPPCPHCHTVMQPGVTMKRCFDEDLDPGFDVAKAMASPVRVSPAGLPDPALTDMLMEQRRTARIRPRHPTRELTTEEKECYGQYGYVAFEPYLASNSSVTGRFWTQVQLDRKACGTTTTMGQALSETYARQPSFYGATYCCCCQTHRPVAEFVWEVDGTLVGS